MFFYRFVNHRYIAAGYGGGIKTCRSLDACKCIMIEPERFHHLQRYAYLLEEHLFMLYVLHFLSIFSVAGEEVAGVDAICNVGEVGGGAVGEDSAAETFEFGEVVDYARAEEG